MVEIDDKMRVAAKMLWAAERHFSAKEAMIIAKFSGKKLGTEAFNRVIVNLIYRTYNL